MTVTLTIAGRTVELDDNESEACLRRLVFVTRQYLWLHNRFRFDDHFRAWEQHNRGHSVNVVLWAVEAVGGANLPPASLARRLKRQRDQIDRTLNPRQIDKFFPRYGRWQPAATRFCNDMARYREAMMLGTARTIRVLEVTRDASFMTLQVCAGILTGGSSAAATTAGATMLRAAGQAFVIQQLEHQATRLGRSMAGQNVTIDETARDVGDSAINAVRDAALGEVVNRFMKPLVGVVQDAALREVSRGRLAEGVAMGVAEDRMRAVVQDAINHFVKRRANETRSYLRECQKARGANACAATFGDRLMQNRQFRSDVEQRLERAAARR